MKSLLQDNYIEIYWTHKEEKSLVAEIFIKTLKSKISKYMTLTLICMGFLEVRFEVLVGWGKITTCLKVVRVTLETWNLELK